ncbi:hypothetical protein PN36_26310 [Candidatus Thiomargarita nelsonii]|uniref:DUF3971 domain-containing protein n=1 Tax=Candidatus Thiomargarita nelsonii TaxID=1003181 RepID=A0A0A6P7J7_9GAMM|nr:hypothetical protein PN36_26310 [Candidatus Thiomargarita nelsonii]
MPKNFLLFILMVLAAILGGLKAYIDQLLRTELNLAINSVADKVTIEYSDVTISLLGAVVINNLRFGEVHIDTVIFHKAYQFYPLSQLPQQLLISIKNVEYSIKDTAAPAPLLLSMLGYAPYYLTPRDLRGLGYAHINADIDIEAHSNQDIVSLSGTISAKAWGDLSFSVDLNNVPPPIRWSSSQGILLAALTASYTNNGLVNRVFTGLAQRDKMSLSHFKDGLISKLKNDLSQASRLLDVSVLERFIQTPQTLTIALQPTPPIRLNALFYSSLKRLNLKMTTTFSLE